MARRLAVMQYQSLVARSDDLVESRIKFGGIVESELGSRRQPENARVIQQDPHAHDARPDGAGVGG
jgi:hypothetical protein